jgi:hypothetical protein
MLRCSCRSLHEISHGSAALSLPSLFMLLLLLSLLLLWLQAVMCKPHRCPHIAMTGNVCVYCPGMWRALVRLVAVTEARVPQFRVTCHTCRRWAGQRLRVQHAGVHGVRADEHACDPVAVQPVPTDT